MALKEAWVFRARLDDKETEIRRLKQWTEEQFEAHPEVIRLREEIKDLQVQYDRAMAQAWNHGITSEGSYVLRISTTKSRTVIPLLFVQKFGLDLFCRIAQVPVEEAERAVGLEALADVCATEEKETGRVVEFIPPATKR